jgi:hypothetical protein
MCFSVDRVEPRILGLPFNLAWLLGWIVPSSARLPAAYNIECRR